MHGERRREAPSPAALAAGTMPVCRVALALAPSEGCWSVSAWALSPHWAAAVVGLVLAMIAWIVWGMLDSADDDHCRHASS